MRKPKPMPIAPFIPTCDVVIVNPNGAEEWEQAMREQERLSMMLPFIKGQLIKCGLIKAGDRMDSVIEEVSRQRGSSRKRSAKR
jgi:hypothetical protein